MNEQQFTESIRLALDESASHLPYRVTHRLQQARQAALARMPAQALEPVAAAAFVVPAPASVAALRGDGRAPRWSRASAALAALLLVAGLALISLWADLDQADETADVDLAVLTDDDVPISGYADRGFGVFMKNTRQ